MILVFLMLSFKPTFSFSSFTFIKRLFISSLSVISVVSSAYLRLLIFLLEKSWFQLVLHPAQRFSWCTLHLSWISRVTIQPWRTPFPIWNQSVVPWPILTVASWPAYRFLKRQVKKKKDQNKQTNQKRGRSGGLVCPSLSELSTVYSDPHSQRLWHSQ